MKYLSYDDCDCDCVCGASLMLSLLLLFLLLLLLLLLISSLKTCSDVGRLVGRTMGRLVGRLVERLVGRTVGPSGLVFVAVVRSFTFCWAAVVRSVSRSSTQSVSQSRYQQADISTGRPD